MSRQDHNFELGPDEQSRIDKEASEWVALQDRGLTAREQDAFLQWLSENPRHRESFNRHKSKWDAFDLMAQWNPEHSEKANPHLLDYLKSPGNSRKIKVAAAVILVTLGVGLFGLFNPFRNSDEAILERMELTSHSYQYHIFEDGSEVDLNAGTEIMVEFTKKIRRIRLEAGEAYFTVAKDPERPFIVEVEGVAVRAVGTEFNVRYAEKESLEVLVTEGQVNLETDARKVGQKNLGESTLAYPELKPGERTRLELQHGALDVRIEELEADQIHHYLQWKPQKFHFSSTPLAEVVDQFNAHNTVQIKLASRELVNLPVSGSFRSVNITGFIRLLEMTRDVRVRRQGESEIVLEKVL